MLKISLRIAAFLSSSLAFLTTACAQTETAVPSQTINQALDIETVEPARPPLNKAPETQIKLLNGEVIGGRSPNGAYEWRGIPFAQPPIGALRWRAPRPPKDWDGVRDATKIHSRCVQYPNNYYGNDLGKLIGQEDCLYLNVHAPNPESIEQPLPVMVWIHGGNNIWGHGGQFDGSKLAVSQNVIVVTINYRLGILGSFANAVNRETALIHGDNNPNFLHLDIAQSLVWIKNNIKAFGGDPNNVTIFGESAGAHNVFSMIATPSAKGLFHKAIAQSGYIGSIPIKDAESGDVNFQGNSFITFDQRVSDLEKRIKTKLSTKTAASSRAVLEALTLEDIYAGLLKRGQHAPMLLMDGSFTSCSSMLGAFEDVNCHNQVPVIAGSNKDESKLFLMGVPYFIKWQDDKKFHKLFHASMHAAIAKYQSIQWELFSVDEPLKALAKAGNENVYAYRFDWDNLKSGPGYDYSETLGAAHALEVPFIFHQFDLFIPRLSLFTPETLTERTELANTMMQYWGNFAHTGAPSTDSDDLPFWHPVNAGNDQYSYFQRLNTGEEQSVRTLKRKLSINIILNALYSDKSIKTRNVRCGVVDAVTFHYPRPLLKGETLLPKGCMH